MMLMMMLIMITDESRSDRSLTPDYYDGKNYDDEDDGNDDDDDDDGNDVDDVEYEKMRGC